MATIERLTRRPDFLAAAEGRRFHTERMTAQGRLRGAGPRDAAVPAGLRLGLTVTKRVGNAPERNRIRRRLRAAVGRLAAELPAAWAALRADIVLIARRPALSADFTALADDLRRAIPAVARPSAGPRGERPPGRASPRRRGSAPAASRGTANGASPLGDARDDVQGAVPGAEAAGPAPTIPTTIPNACAGVPDGQ